MVKQNFEETNLASNEAVGEKLRSSFFDLVRSRFLAMAAAGLITLGVGWERSLADQLKIKMPEKKGAVPEFVLETGITDNKLEALEKRLASEEPDFLRWLDAYEADFRNELDRLLATVSNSQDDPDKHQTMLSFGTLHHKDSDAEEVAGIVDEAIEKDHEILNGLKSKSADLEWAVNFLKIHLHRILMSAILLDDSSAVRNSISRLNKSPKLSFSVHDAKILDSTKAISAYVSLESDDIHRPIIKLMPRSFLGGDNSTNMPTFIFYIIHELMHAFHWPPNQDVVADFNSSFFQMLREGVTQNLTYEITQYLSTFRSGLKLPLGGNYDVRVFVTALMDSILEANGRASVLDEWHAGIIGDGQLFQELEGASANLGLAPDTFSGVRTLRPESNSSQVFSAVSTIVGNMKLKQLNLSDQLIRDLFFQNREVENFEAVEPIIKGIRP